MYPYLFSKLHVIIAAYYQRTHLWYNSPYLKSTTHRIDKYYVNTGSIKCNITIDFQTESRWVLHIKGRKRATH